MDEDLRRLIDEGWREVIRGRSLRSKLARVEEGRFCSAMEERDFWGQKERASGPSF
jgi:hypothetical protein